MAVAVPRTSASATLDKPSSSGVARTLTLPYCTVGRVISISATVDLSAVLVTGVPELLLGDLFDEVVLLLRAQRVPLFVGVAHVDECVGLLVLAPDPRT